jgi:hypothetical protein
MRRVCTGESPPYGRRFERACRVRERNGLSSLPCSASAVYRGPLGTVGSYRSCIPHNVLALPFGHPAESDRGRASFPPCAEPGRSTTDA